MWLWYTMPLNGAHIKPHASTLPSVFTARNLLQVEYTISTYCLSLLAPCPDTARHDIFREYMFNLVFTFIRVGFFVFPCHQCPWVGYYPLRPVLRIPYYRCPWLGYYPPSPVLLCHVYLKYE